MVVDTRIEALETEVRAAGRLPQHLAIIMDGNGRWAQQRHLPRIAGHKSSRDTVRRVVRLCARLGIPNLTLYTFSQENWKRPEIEVRALMKLLEEVLEGETLELDQNNVRLTYMGCIDALPESTRTRLLHTASRLAKNTGLVLNLALSYGGRRRSPTPPAGRGRRGRRRPSHRRGGRGAVHDLLYRPELPDPDLLIRTSGEQRISNFLLWQLAYTELYFTEVLWPDFSEEDLLVALREFQSGNAALVARAEAARGGSRAPPPPLAGPGSSPPGRGGLRPVFAIIAWRGGVFFVILVNFVALAATFEFQRLLEAKGLRAQWGTSIAAAIVLPWLVFWRGAAYADLGLLLLFVCSMAQELGRPIADALLRVAGASFSLLYVAWLPSFLVRLRELPLASGAPYAQGFTWVVFVFLVAWMSDAGAYAVGSVAGRHQLAPRISPGKSVEGSIGGLVFAIVSGAVAAPLFMKGILTPVAGAAFGLLGSVAGQIGDLVESQLKRDAQVKDTSGAIPGHGGTLDRFDSVFFAAPLVYFVLRLAAV